MIGDAARVVLAEISGGGAGAMSALARTVMVELVGIRAARPWGLIPGLRERRPSTALAGGRWAARLDGRARIRDEGISGTRGRDKRPGLDVLLKGVARRKFDLVAAWTVRDWDDPCPT